MTETIELRIDQNELTIGDMLDFEDYTGMTFEKAFKPIPVLDEDGVKVKDADGRTEMTVDVSAKTLLALVWIFKRKDQEDFSVEDAKKVKVTSLEWVTDESDPKETE